MSSPQPIDESFFEAAPQRFERRFVIDRPATAVWSELTGERPLHWCRVLDIEWTSPRPFGVGTTRHAKVLGLLEADERYFLWEEGHRHAFYFENVNLPLFARFGEYYEVEPIGEQRCILTWKLASEPSPLGRGGGPVNKLLVASMFRDTEKHFSA